MARSKNYLLYKTNMTEAKKARVSRLEQLSRLDEAARAMTRERKDGPKHYHKHNPES